LEFAVVLMVPAPVTEIWTVTLLPPFLRTDTVPEFELIDPPTHDEEGGGMKVPPPPLTLHGLSSKCEAVPLTIEEVYTSVLAFTLVIATAAGVQMFESIVMSPEPAT